jgi:hypothetical protein
MGAESSHLLAEVLMVNQEHLDILKQGETWNQRLEGNLGISPYPIQATSTRRTSVVYPLGTFYRGAVDEEA